MVGEGEGEVHNINGEQPRIGGGRGGNRGGGRGGGRQRGGGKGELIHKRRSITFWISYP